MKKYTGRIAAAGMLLTIIISNITSFVVDGRRLDKLRGSVLRLHILANSDSSEDQRLKICVRDALLMHGDELFGNADSLEAAEALAEEKLAEIEQIAAEALRAENCMSSVTASVVDMHFDERVYGDITMPAGDYMALRIEIGEAQGHNWWCVMYPPLCIPAACKLGSSRSAEEEYFSVRERDILDHPKKYRVKFAVWDKFKKLFK